MLSKQLKVIELLLDNVVRLSLQEFGDLSMLPTVENHTKTFPKLLHRTPKHLMHS